MVAIEEVYHKYLTTSSVTIDTRDCAPGAMFFAIRGANFNGNSFAAQALAKGAQYVVIDDPAYAKPSSAYILVKDSLGTLTQLATYHRLQYGIHFPVIAITGSYGKTTTKKLIYNTLSTKYTTTATKGNLNTPIGVALTLLSMRRDTEIAVVEMGATQLGDITLCCNIARPTHGLITAIGAAHLEGFGNLEGVITGKKELYDYLYNADGTIFLNTLLPLLAPISRQFKKVLTYPQPNDFAPLQLVGQTPYLRCKSSELFTTHLLGRPHLYNIAAALCVAKYFKVPAAHRAIEAYIPTNQRMQLVIQGSNQIIIDSYNASPASVEAALETLLELKVTYRVVILGDMADLGSQTNAWHNKIIQQLGNPYYDRVLLCGPHFTLAAQNQFDTRIICFPKKEELADYIVKNQFQHSGILLKGAHSLAIDTLMERFI